MSATVAAMMMTLPWRVLANMRTKEKAFFNVACLAMTEKNGQTLDFHSASSFEFSHQSLWAVNLHVQRNGKPKENVRS